MLEIGLGRALLAAGLAWLVLKLLHPWAPRLNLLDFPQGRKDHAHPTPIIGGLAMVTGFLAVMALDVGQHAGTSLLAFAAASLLLVAVGLYDDRNDLRWYWRILAQVAAALVMV
ncbi:MAG: hypothetical protein GX856_07965, partial [Gammaproteobacteria bacterium]|nr:hypothetical protein [Gammaproteobacteria bacterium]